MIAYLQSQMQVNDVTRLQALVDKKKVVITEDTIRDALRLDDAEGIDCLPNDEIFTALARMGYEKPFTKLTFCDLSSYSTKYSSPALTQKVFANIRRVGKCFSRVDTPLFEGMLVAQEVGKGAPEVNVEDVPAAGVVAEAAASVADDGVNAAERMIADMDADVDVTLKDIAKDVAFDANIKESADVQGRQAESQAQIYQINLEHADKVLNKGKGILVEEPKPLKKQAQIEQDKAYARELAAELNKNIDWDEVIDHVKRKRKEDNAVMRYRALKRKPQTEGQARKNMMVYLRNMAGYKMDYFKGMSYDDMRPIFKKYFNSNMAFLHKTKEQMDEEDNKALKRLNESQEDKASKRQKLDQEVEELRRHLQIVLNDEDDVYTEANPLALKIITFTTTQLILLVERKYPLTRCTLNQMLNNVRLKVEEESEVSLELLKITRQQQQGYLHGVLSRWKGDSIVMGDFNKVRVPSEGHGSVFNKQGASLFNSFINSSNLIDVTLGSFLFTWALKNVTKMSKLDRFLVSEGLLCLFPSMMGIILTRNLSDHRPILLKECDIDYGPTPFKIFQSWFDIEGFDQMLKDAWNSKDVDDTNEMVYLKKKFQKLKKRISSWVYENRSISIERMKAILDKLFMTWIKGCLTSLSASILVNGSPTQEFYFEKGLRQRDPLSPFLFLLVMEALRLSFVRAMDGGFFKGVLVGSHEPTFISHLFYVDDAVFIGEWREENLRHLLHAWDSVIEKVRAILSKWKAKTLSIGGRFMLTKSMLSSIPLFYFSLFKVPIGVLKRLESCRSNFFRGVEEGSRKRFKVQPDVMWVSIIKAIYGRYGSLDYGAQVEELQGGIEGVQLEEASNLIASIELVEEQDKWVWNLEEVGEFKVASTRRFIDEGLTEMEGAQTRWVKSVPIKVNVFAWCLALNKLPTRFNMSSRGLDISSIVCLGGGIYWTVAFLLNIHGFPGSKV
nr:RNA-directed DNA polymerase, eukaryota [Tanacetum cinerariifolium]